jgi:hypothetical protein
LKETNGINKRVFVHIYFSKTDSKKSLVVKSEYGINIDVIRRKFMFFYRLNGKSQFGYLAVIVITLGVLGWDETALAGTLTLRQPEVNTITGEVTIKGVDTARPSTPFTWDWGDGNIEDGWFPMQHTYSDVTRNYTVSVTSHYSDGTIDEAQTRVQFIYGEVEPVELWEKAKVTIPEYKVELASRMSGYHPSSRLTYMGEECFPRTPRETVEYVLSVAAIIQLDFVEGDVLYPDGTFDQVILNDPCMTGGMYSLWYTTPVAFAMSCDIMSRNTMLYSCLFHEMGHNVTLNFPAGYHYGGKIDGKANAIYSETMAQIFQYATASEIVSRVEEFGIGEDVVADIIKRDQATSNFRKNAYDRYVANGCPFCTWNTSETQEDDTLDTFLTASHKFITMATEAGLSMRIPVRRLCKFLGHFNSDWKTRYARKSNTPEADAFRATLLVTAFSYAFGRDIREDFRELAFPVDDDIYDELMNTVVQAPCNGIGYLEGDLNRDCIVDLADLALMSNNWLKCNMVPNPE